nr:uncharacterized protein LOC111988036 [Quercus suber]
MSDLKALLKTRDKKAEPKGTGTSRPVVNLPPPPPQVPDPGLKPVPDLKKKRPLEPEEREVVVPPKTTKQQKVVRDHKSKRALSVESQEEPSAANVRRGQRTWSPRLELDGAPFSWETSIRNYDEGRAGLITQQVFVAEEWNRKAYVKAQAEAHSRSKAEKTLGSLKEEFTQISEQLKEVTQERNNLNTSLQNAESQAETQHKLLNETQTNLASKKALVKELHAELQKAREAAKLAQRNIQLAKEATEAEKKAVYQLGVDVTEKDAAEVPADSELRLPGSIYYDPNIRELPESDPPPPTQLPEVSEQSLVSQVPPTTLEVSKESGQPGDPSKPAEPSKDKGKNSKKEKTSSKPKDQVSTAAVTQTSQAADPVVPQTKT